jgi:hypothetical protein
MAQDTFRFPSLQLDERMLEWLNSQQERELRGKMRGLGKTVGLSPPRACRPKRKRKAGGGRKQRLTPEQTAKLQRVYCDLLENHPQIKQASAVKTLQDLFKPKIVSYGTVVRHVIRPVRDTRESK